MAPASVQSLAVALIVSVSVGCAPRAPALEPIPVGVRAVAMRTSLVTVEEANPRLAQALAALGSAPAASGLIDVAEAYRRAGIGDKAIEYYLRVLQAEHRNAAAHDGQARVWRDWGFPGVGLAEAYRAVYYAPASPECRNTLGTILQALGNSSAAREQYVKAVALDPRAAYALNNTCALDVEEGRAAAAVEACMHALEIDAGLESARWNLARAEALLSREKSRDSNARH